MRLINADKLYPDTFGKGRLAVSQSQIADAPTVQAVPIEKIKTLINDIEVMRTNPTVIDNDDVDLFIYDVLFALNRLIEGNDPE